MYKILLLSALLLSGCANIKVTGAMCDRIESQPGMIIPQECRAYDEAKADKAFNKTKNEKIHSNEDIIKFSKDTDDN
ncbi:hypothetical protein [Sulfurimonas sp.]|uniref:hypothetical protein n=1 Tax=Sulfurimonas sp. TaxID=2022749 RepID=UPI002606082F|nr:hypothetical protein [Sulfurimonas sp.]